MSYNCRDRKITTCIACPLLAASPPCCWPPPQPRDSLRAAAGQRPRSRRSSRHRSRSTSSAASPRRCRSPSRSCRRRPRSRHRRRADRRARPAGRRDRRQRPRRAPACSRRSAPAGFRAVAFPRSTAPDFGLGGDRRAGPRPGLRPGQWRRHSSPSAAISTTSPAKTELTRQGYRRQPARLAPRRAQMRRHGLYPPDRRRALFRQPRRLCLRDRAQGARGSSGSRSWIRTAPTTAS